MTYFGIRVAANLSGAASYWIDVDYNLQPYPLFPFKTEAEAQNVLDGLSQRKQMRATIVSLQDDDLEVKP